MIPKPSNPSPLQHPRRASFGRNLLNKKRPPKRSSDSILPWRLSSWCSVARALRATNRKKMERCWQLWPRASLVFIQNHFRKRSADRGEIPRRNNGKCWFFEKNTEIFFSWNDLDFATKNAFLIYFLFFHTLKFGMEFLSRPIRRARNDQSWTPETNDIHCQSVIKINESYEFWARMHVFECVFVYVCTLSGAPF